MLSSFAGKPVVGIGTVVLGAWAYGRGIHGAPMIEQVSVRARWATTYRAGVTSW